MVGVSRIPRLRRSLMCRIDSRDIHEERSLGDSAHTSDHRRSYFTCFQDSTWSLTEDDDDEKSIAKRVLL